MNWARAALLQTRHSAREILPWRAARFGCAALLLALEALLCGLTLTHVPTRHPPGIGVLGGFAGFNLLVATAAASVTLSELLLHPERLMLLSLSPREPQWTVRLALAPSVVAATSVVTFFTLPFALAATWRFPGIAVEFVMLAAASLGWAALLAVSLGAAFGRRLGLARGARVLRALSGALGFGALVAFGKLSRLHGGPALVLGFLVLTPLALPPLWKRAAANFVSVLGGHDTSRESPEPNWGSPSWGRLLRRSLSALGLVGAAPAIWVVAARPELRPSIASLLLVQAAGMPLDHLWQPELTTPDRLKLAPEGAAYRRRLFLAWGGGPLCAVWLATAWLGWRHWGWVAAVCAVALAVPATQLLRARSARSVARGALVFVSLAAGFLWRP